MNSTDSMANDSNSDLPCLTIESSTTSNRIVPVVVVVAVAPCLHSMRAAVMVDRRSTRKDHTKDRSMKSKRMNSCLEDLLGRSASFDYPCLSMANIPKIVLESNVALLTLDLNDRAVASKKSITIFSSSLFLSFVAILT
jgi:hypothetical protein